MSTFTNFNLENFLAYLVLVSVKGVCLRVHSEVVYSVGGFMGHFWAESSSVMNELEDMALC